VYTPAKSALPEALPDPEIISAPPTRKQGWLRLLLRWGLPVLAVLALLAGNISSPQARFFVTERFQTFVTIFLGIFIEAAPFLLIGSIVSGFIDVFVDRERLEKLTPRQPLLAALAGTGLGLIFPVCECGVVPVTRRLYEKGFPISTGIAFLLAAPVINPVVIASTWAAFGWGPILWGRIGLSLLIAFGVGIIFQLAKPDELLLSGLLEQRTHQHSHGASHLTGLGAKIALALRQAGDDFLDMARYLVVGSMLAAAMQTLVPQNALLAVGQGPVLSVFVLMALAFVLSVCSTVDAFLALAFTSTFTGGAIVGFLTFGPMVDIKSSLMFLGIFRRRTVVYLILLPFALSALFAVGWNFLVGV